MIECQEDADRGCGMVIVTFTKSLCCKTVGSLVWQGDIKTVSKLRTNSRYSPVSNLRFPEKSARLLTTITVCLLEKSAE